jgi:hypothetical protein
MSHPTSELSNVKRSFESWFNTTFGGSFAIDFEGVPFKSTDKSEWLQPRILTGGSIFHRQVESGYRGDTLFIIVNINIFVRKNSSQKADRIYTIRDTLFDSMHEGTSVDIRDYVNGGAIVAVLKSREILDDFIVPIKETEDLIQYNFSVEYNYLRKY